MIIKLTNFALLKIKKKVFFINKLLKLKIRLTVYLKRQKDAKWR